ncbi:UNVERIFIED_CONTAM: hypothetical protein GTU68_043121 [Idotea baltica]|nr:hypothetical protein [Idotea baltica]
MSNGLEHLFENNLKWSNSIKRKDPEFFSTLSKQQAPEILWIGCADSRVPANEIINLPPGEVFVHRNIANVVVHSDLNCLSVIQFAVDVLKVKHIIVVGHYGCGGIKASMDDESYGLIDNWLSHIKDVSRFHRNELEKLEGEDKANRLCELNAIEQVKNVANTTIVTKAWKRGEQLSIHGWVYGLEDGIAHDQNCTVSSLEELKIINDSDKSD